MTKFSLLTPEEENLIPQYQEKWRDIQLSTEPIDRQKAEDAVKAACAAMRSKVPEIVFCDSPYAALKLKAQSSKASQSKRAIAKPTGSEYTRVALAIQRMALTFLCTLFRKRFQARNPISNLQESLSKSALKQWKNKLELSIPKDFRIQDLTSQAFQSFSEHFPNVPEQLSLQDEAENSDSESLQQPTLFPFQNRLWRWWIKLWAKQFLLVPIAAQIQGTDNPEIDALIQRKLLSEMPEHFQIQHNPTVFVPQSAAIASILWDFSTSVLNFSINEKRWQAFQSLVRECGWIFSFDRQIVICDRPRQLSFDTENHLHAEGEPAIQFADGFSIYAHHGVILPEKYGQLHPEQWQAKWLLEERNAELRRVLIQGIGYARLCQDLEAIELDSWQDYTLLKIDSDVDVEPIHLLKMTCPSTAYVHAARVPPNVRSAREAIRWVNWDTDPEEFSQQT